MKIDDVVVYDGFLREQHDITELAKSIKEIGLLNPITVTPKGELIAGHHRLRACASLGWTEIPARVVDLNGARRELAEIDENLVRADYTALERGEKLARRKELYEQIHPETRAGVAGGKASGASRRGEERTSETISFVDDTAAKIGLTQRSVQQDVQIATDIVPDVKDTIRSTPLADSKVDLLKLARLEPERQREVVDKITKGDAKTVREALGEDPRQILMPGAELGDDAPRHYPEQPPQSPPAAAMAGFSEQTFVLGLKQWLDRVASDFAAQTSARPSWSIENPVAREAYEAAVLRAVEAFLRALPPDQAAAVPPTARLGVIRGGKA